MAQVEAGEKVVITRRGKPVVRLVSCKPWGRRKPDVLEDKVTISDAFFDPLPNEELEAWGVLVSTDAAFDPYGIKRLR